jgi:hypothetical protein
LIPEDVVGEKAFLLPEPGTGLMNNPYFKSKKKKKKKGGKKGKKK